MTAVSEQIGVWLAEFTRQPKAEPWLQKLREAGFQRFSELGFPTTHDEEWRFTNVAPIARTRFSHRQAEIIRTIPASGEHLEPTGAESHLARHAGFEQTAFVALNAAFLDQVQVVGVPRGVLFEQPIEITYQAPERFAGQDLPAAVHPRSLILV